MFAANLTYTGRIRRDFARNGAMPIDVDRPRHRHARMDAHRKQPTMEPKRGQTNLDGTTGVKLVNCLVDWTGTGAGQGFSEEVIGRI